MWNKIKSFFSKPQQASKSSSEETNQPISEKLIDEASNQPKRSIRYRKFPKFRENSFR